MTHGHSKKERFNSPRPLKYFWIFIVLSLVTKLIYAAPSHYTTEPLVLRPKSGEASLPPKPTTITPSSSKHLSSPPKTVLEACSSVQARLNTLNEAMRASGPKNSTLTRLYQLEQNEWRYYCR